MCDHEWNRTHRFQLQPSFGLTTEEGERVVSRPQPDTGNGHDGSRCRARQGQRKLATGDSSQGQRRPDLDGCADSQQGT